jgi:hypothetical protein
MGGRIEVQSTVDVGTTISVYIPSAGSETSGKNLNEKFEGTEV